MGCGANSLEKLLSSEKHLTHGYNYFAPPQRTVSQGHSNLETNMDYKSGILYFLKVLLWTRGGEKIQ